MNFIILTVQATALKCKFHQNISKIMLEQHREMGCKYHYSCILLFRNYRVRHLVVKKMVLDEAMAWLNTLGGGYSALGDAFKYCVSK